MPWHRLGSMSLRDFRKTYSGAKEKRAELAAALKGWMLRRRKDVLKDLGTKSRQVRYISPPEGLGAYQEIYAVVNSNNQLIPAGLIDTGQGSFAIKVPGIIRTGADALSLPIKRTADAVVTLGDVAEVRRTFKDAETFSRINGEQSIALEVVQRAGRYLQLLGRRVNIAA